MKSTSRRNFIRTSIALSATASIPSTFFIGKSYSANDTIGVGIIGMGWRGGQLSDSFKNQKGARIAAIADPDETLSAKAGNFDMAKGYTDLRQLLDDPNVDVVAVSTCNHWHCLASIMAMQAGKDVYVEKPLSHTQWEGRQVVNAAQKYKKIVQLGTQHRSDLQLQDAAKQFLHKDKSLGDIHYIQANRLGVREQIGKRQTPLDISEDVDYNLWLGPAADQKIYRDKLHYDWHWDFNTGNGEMGNWGVHILDDVRNVGYQDSVILPKRILAVGGRPAWGDAGNTPNVHFVCFDTGTYPTILALSNMTQAPNKTRGSWSANADRDFTGPGSGYVVACEGGYYLGQRGSGKAIDLKGKEIASFKGGDRVPLHTGNFLEAVRKQDNSILNAEIETGHASSGWCNLANVAYQVGEAYDRKKAESISPNLNAWGQLLDNMEEQLSKFNVDLNGGEIKMSPILTHDSEKEVFVGEHANAANQYLKRTYREPFVVPEIV